jgi:hypothetical protein
MAGAPAEQATVRKIKNIQCCHNLIFSNLLLLKIPAFLTALPLTFSMITMQSFDAILLHNCFVRDDPDL